MPWTPPRLDTERLYLLAPDDGKQPQFVFDGRNAVEQNLFDLPSNWKIFLKETDEPVGTIGFIRWEPNDRSAEIGFIMMNMHTGRGYMTEGGIAVLAFGFEEMGAIVIEAKSLPWNAASLRVLEKIGMKKERRILAQMSSKAPLVDMDLFVIRKTK